MSLRKTTVFLNGVKRNIICDPEKDTLATAIRRMGLTGTKVGCGVGQCGSCSIILNGEIVRSCTRRMKNIAENSQIETIEGIGTASNLHPLQQAFMTYGSVQCGFCSPGFIMSAKALLDQNVNPTREEVRAWFQKHRNVCRCTGYKPIVDAVMAAAKVLRGEAIMEDIAFKMEGNQVYGTALPRPTALAKVTGLCDYGDDLKYKMPEDTLHLAIVQPRVSSHAKILNIDTAQAEAMTGVVKVVTAKDIKGLNRVIVPLDHPRSIMKGLERPLLADKKIFRYGDVVAVVVAETEEQAREAAKMVKVEIEPLPEYMNVLDAVAPDAIRIHEETPNTYLKQPVLKGALASDVIDESFCAVEGSFYSSREAHLSVEGDTMQGYWDEDGNLVIQCKSQAIGFNRLGIAYGIGIDPEKLRIIENPTGASFGWAASPGSFALMGACLMEIKDRPLTLTMSYEEHMHFSGKRAPAYSNARLACDEKGKLTALEFDVAMDRGPYTEYSGHIMEKVMRFMGWPYNIPNVTGLGRIAFTNHCFATAYRGFGCLQAYTTSEAIMDMLAEKMGMDPFEFRYQNIARDGQTNINGYPFKEYPMEEIMDTLRPIYQGALAKAKAESTDTVKRGVGIAMGGFNVTLGPGDHAEVALELNPDGTITHYNTWEDQGQGGDIGTLSVTHEALKPLGLTADQIRLCMNDSHRCPDTGIAAGSRSHFMAGYATIDAANKLMNAMRKPEGTFRTYSEMAAEDIPTKYLGVYDTTGTGTPLDPNTGVGDPTQAYMYGAFLAEVEVNVETGKAMCVGMTSVGDVGKIGNILAVEGQAYGGLSHSISFALKTNYDDLKKGSTMAGAGIPYCQEIPDKFDNIFLENPRKVGPFGSSGCSELYQSSGHVAVINAIYNAVGVRIYELPATPEKIKAGLEAKARGEDLKPKKYFLGSDLYDEIEEINTNPV
ncbi:2Fe-2S iron-sulfur cluster binding domain-containing protein [Desulfosporosinus fructosivorans]|uniref:2Fe-2S iron-sulfur cluster binding domain-containing protein n=1 Tax=Desulfosporosinus fructosivorans TaxID=2018669 RepID=A0A4Z0RAF4_9FIRM|nr:molybdopterin cofactor-binding domain-containing protein [Desulfosporosinus fructosivorans]TGE39325.1 2Fe-2S iron-sulfur cluster binding domain-containing protein [Desulfosporosinus fructosivorans]